jgi:hypothetical protein
MTKKKINYGYKKVQEQIKLVAYNKVLAFENFRYLLEALEEYVEKAGYYSNFKDRRQLRNITIPKEKNYSLSNCEELFRTKLLLFVGILGNDTPESTRKEIQQEFYKWISTVGINTDNCHDEKLKNFLLETNNVLEGNGEKIVNQTRDYLESEKDRPTTIQDAEKAIELFESIQSPINDKEKTAELYKDKNYFEVEFENKFNGGSVQQGEQMFNQLISDVYGNSFCFYKQNNPQRRSNSEIIQDVKTNPQN